MDSLSQIVLGAAVAEVVIGKKTGNKAILIGAIAGTIPDLDIFISAGYTDEIEKLTIHRGYSHSLFTHLLLAIPFAWLCYRIFGKRITMKRWYWVWFLCLSTHAILDSFTTYGTQLFLPFTNYLVGFNNISVVDPLWTIPFLITIIVAMFLRRDNPSRIKWAWGGIIYASAYMLMTFANKYAAHQHFAQELNRQHIGIEHLYTTPSIFNNILWSGIATTPDSIYFGEYSLIQDDPVVDWVAYPRNPDLLEQHPAKRAIEVLTWFSQDKHFAEKKGEDLYFYPAKWGRMNYREKVAEKAFVVHWKIIRKNGTWTAEQAKPNWGKEEFAEAMAQLWRRILNK